MHPSGMTNHSLQFTSRDDCAPLACYRNLHARNCLTDIASSSASF